MAVKISNFTCLIFFIYFIECLISVNISLNAQITCKSVSKGNLLIRTQRVKILIKVSLGQIQVICYEMFVKQLGLNSICLPWKGQLI